METQESLAANLSDCINGVNLRLAIENVKDFVVLQPKIIFVRGRFYEIKVKRSGRVSNARISLCVRLIEPIRCPNKAIIMWLSVKVFSLKNVPDWQKHIIPYNFNSRFSECSTDIITMNELLNPESGYVFNNKTEIELHIKTSKAMDLNDEQLIKIDTVANMSSSHELYSHLYPSMIAYRKYILTLRKFTELEAVPAPLFNIDGITMEIITDKGNNFLNPKFNGQHFLQLYFTIHCFIRPVQITVSGKVLSFEPSVGYQAEAKTHTANYVLDENIGIVLPLISRNDLTDPLNRFVHNDSIFIEVEVTFNHVERPQLEGRSIKVEVDDDSSGASEGEL